MIYTLFIALKDRIKTKKGAFRMRCSYLSFATKTILIIGKIYNIKNIINSLIVIQFTFESIIQNL
jgi:hypothetical protein